MTTPRTAHRTTQAAIGHAFADGEFNTTEIARYVIRSLVNAHHLDREHLHPQDQPQKETTT